MLNREIFGPVLIQGVNSDRSLQVKEEDAVVKQESASEEQSEQQVPAPAGRSKRKEAARVRVKPDIGTRARERTLAKIATRGIVQLFNAVRSQQKEISSRVEQAGPLLRNKEQVRIDTFLSLSVAI